MTPATTEKQWTDQVRKIARLMGWLDYHTYRSTRSTPGFPDLVLVRGDRIIFAELKREKGGVLSPAQRVWLDALAATNLVEVHVWRPSDLPVVKLALMR